MTAPDVVAEAPVAPVTPAAAPAAAPVVEPDKEQLPPDQLLSRREARRGLHQDRAPKPATVDSASTDTTPPAGGSEALPPPSAAPPPSPAAPAAITIPIPEGHPLREMGATEFVVQTPQQERAIRAALNGYARRAETEELKAKLRERDLREAEHNARRTASEKWMGRPEYQAALLKYNEMKDAFGEQEAEFYWRGVNAEFERLAQEEIQGAVAAIEEREHSENAQRWKNEAWQNASLLPQSVRNLPKFGEWFEEAVASFDSEVRLGHYPQVTNFEEAHKAFNAFFGSKLTTRPEVIALYRASTQQDEQRHTSAAAKAAEEQRQRERIAQEAVDKYKRDEAANRRTQVPPHPLANLGAVNRDQRPQSGTPTAGEPAAELTAADVRRQARAGAREDARRRFAGT